MEFVDNKERQISYKGEGIRLVSIHGGENFLKILND